MREMNSKEECRAGVGVEQVVKYDDDYASELHLAVKENDVHGVRKLLEGGAKVNAPDKLWRTPLHWALVYGHQEAAKALILNTNRIALESRDSWGCTALHYAALGGRTEVGRILIERGAQVNSVDSKKRTPLHFAAQHPQPAMVEMLISRGADKQCRDFREYLPCDVALEWASFSSLACLRPDSQKKDLQLKVHPVKIIDEHDRRGEGQGEVGVRKSPSLHKLIESWKKSENEARKKKEAESEVVAKAFIQLQERLDEWRVVQRDAKLRQRGNNRSMSLTDNGIDVLPREKHLSHVLLSPGDQSCSSEASPSQSPSSRYSDVLGCSMSSEGCVDDESYSTRSSSFLPSASSSCQGNVSSPPNLHDWLDAPEQLHKKVGFKERLLWCTEWEVEFPQSSECQQTSHEDVIDTLPIFPRDRKGKAKVVSDEEPTWLQVWPRSSSPSSTLSISPNLRQSRLCDD